MIFSGRVNRSRSILKGRLSERIFLLIYATNHTNPQETAKRKSRFTDKPYARCTLTILTAHFSLATNRKGESWNEQYEGNNSASW